MISLPFAGLSSFRRNRSIRVVMQVKISNAAIMLLAIGLPVSAASAQDLSEDVVELRQMILEMRDDYERRIGELEARLDEAERDARGAERKAGEAIELAEETAIGHPPARRPRTRSTRRSGRFSRDTMPTSAPAGMKYPASSRPGRSVPAVRALRWARPRST